MGLRNSKPKHSKGKKIEKSVRNKDGQQMNEFTEPTSNIRHSAKKPGKKNSDVGFQTKKYKTKSKINWSAQETDESETDKKNSIQHGSKKDSENIHQREELYGRTSRGYIYGDKKNSIQHGSNKDFEYIHQREKPYGSTSRRYIYGDKKKSIQHGSKMDYENICQRKGPDGWTSTGFISDEISSPPYRCRSSDNYEEQVSRMDKIRAQGIPSVPRRNRPAPPPPDLLE